jgi:hypothetical protein
MKQGVATARPFQQTLEKIDPKCSRPRLKASLSSWLTEVRLAINEEGKGV